MSFSNQNVIPSRRHISRNPQTILKQQPKTKKLYSQGDTLIDAIANGDFDDRIIENFKYLKLDLKKSVSGAKWHDQFSTYRKLAENMGLNSNDDRIIRELYRVIMYNKRFIRDKLESKPNDDKIIVFQSVNYVEIQLPESTTPKKFNFHPTNEIPVHFDAHLILPRDPVKLDRGPQPISDVELVDWGSNPVERLCPRCNHNGNTKIQYRIGCCTWTWVVSLILSVLCLPCSWFPCALNCSKDTLHICPKCLYILGIVPRNICFRKFKAFNLKSRLTPYHNRKTESKENLKHSHTTSNIIEIIPRDDDGASDFMTEECHLQYDDQVHETDKPILPISREVEEINYEEVNYEEVNVEEAIKFEEAINVEEKVKYEEEGMENKNQNEQFIVSEIFRNNMKITI